MTFIRYITFVFLTLCAFFDIRTKRIPLWILLVFGSMILGITGISGTLIHQSLCLQLLPGMVFLLMSLLTGEAVGYGDGIVILLLGVSLGIRLCVSIVFVGLVLCAGVSLLILILKKGSQQTRLPFMPFLLAAWGVLFVGGERM